MSTLSFEEYQLKLSQCMRDQGIDQPDPGAADNGGMVIHGGGVDIGPALKACQAKLGVGPMPTEADKKKMEEKAQKEQLAIAKCYRASGVDVPDPQPGQALKLPSDVSPEVTTKCGGGAGGTAARAG